MTTRRPLRLFAALVAVFALAGAACSDDGGDDDDASAASSTEETTSTGDPAPATGDADDADDEGTTDTDDGSTTTDPDDDTTTTEPEEGSLASRLPDIEGYEREADDGDGDSVTDEHCDGTVPTLQPVEEASADYESDDGTIEELAAIAAVRFSSEDDASSAYDEFVASTSGCESDDSLTVDEGASTDIGDEGMSWELTFGGQAGGALYATRVGDELWFLTVFGANGSIDEPVLTAYVTAAEG